MAGRLTKNEGVIEGFLEKVDGRGGQKVRVTNSQRGQKAITQYRVLERYGEASLVDISLNTGRTHQIRVQFAHLGHPVLGDKIYGQGKSRLIARQALHASLLGFAHPITGKRMEFHDKLPADILQLIETLREGRQ